MKIVWAIGLFLALPVLQGQSSIQPDPSTDLLMAITDEWLVWNRIRRIDDGKKFHEDRTSVSNSFYLQRIGKTTARLIYTDTIGMIQSFSPVWVRDEETIIGWDAFFQILRKGQLEQMEFSSLPGSLYYPVLCGVNRHGVMLLTQNDQKTSDAYERVYFVPWTHDEKILDMRRAVLITDTLGIPFFWPSVRWHDDAILCWRPPVLFSYDLGHNKLDSVRIPVSTESGGPSHIAAFDGERILIEHGSDRILYSISSGKSHSIALPTDFTVFAVHGPVIYGVAAAALTKSDTLDYQIRSYHTDRQTWQTLLRLNGRDVNEEIGLPPVVLKDDSFLIWTSEGWKKVSWVSP